MHFFGKKNRLSFSPALQQLKLEDAIGKTIVCEDGTPRRVVTVVHSFEFPWRCIINERDPDSKSGYFVNYISLSSQLEGKGVPSQGAQQAFADAIKTNREYLSEQLGLTE